MKSILDPEMLPYELNSKNFIEDLKKIARISELVSQEPIPKDFALKYPAS